MQQENTIELGTRNIGSLLLKYSLPAIIAMISTSLYNIIDSIFVGHGVGGAAISGMAITMPIMNIAIAFGSMIGIGAGARISIRLGEKNQTAAEKTLANAIMLNCITGATIMTVMLLFMDEILMLFSGGEANPETIGYAKDFMTIIMAGNVITHLLFGMNDMIRASGYPKKAMAIMVTSVFITICLNPVFIFVFHWGIKGSAYATIISQFLSLFIAIHHFLSKNSTVRFRKYAFKFDKQIIRNILSIGLAPFLVNICASLVFSFINTALLRYGGVNSYDIVRDADNDAYVGAYGIINRVVLLFIMVIQGINQGMQPIVGYNYGSRQLDRVRKTLFYAIGCGVFISTIGFCVAQFCPHAVASLFVDPSRSVHDAHIIEIVNFGIRIVMCAFPLVGFQVITVGFFQFIGKAQLSIIMSLTRQLIFLVPLLWIIPRSLGALGVMICPPIADTLSTILALFILVRELKKLK